MKNIQIKSSLLLFLTATIWGVAFVAQSVGMDYVGPFTFSFIRCVIGGISLLPVIAVMRIHRKRSRPHQPVHAEASSVNDDSAKKGSMLQLAIGGVGCGIFLFIASNLQQIGIQYTTVGKAGFITACYIIFVPVIGLFLKRKTGLFIWVAVGMAVVGLYLLCMTDGFTVNKGDVYMLLCAVAFAGHVLYIDHFSPKVDGVKMSCIQFFVCGVLSGVVMLFFENPQMSLIVEAWLPILYAGIMSCGVAYTLQIVGQKNMNPTAAALIMSLESCVSVLAGWLLLGQSMSVREMIGSLVMFAAIVLAQMPAPAKK